ncbi:MAG: glycoside hydrolase family 16 protein [Leifsonia sp.]
MRILDRTAYEPEFDDDFDEPELDAARWLPVYLPQWSSRELSRARYSISEGALRLRIDADQPAWAPEYDGGLRVSNLQTGVRSGPAGSTDGQHRFRPGLVVREAQPELRLYTPRYGLFEVRACAIADPRYLVALWMIGFEDVPEHSAEICIMEVFGSEVAADAFSVGIGVHPFGDPAIVDDFEKVVVTGDAIEFHTYSVEWLPDAVHFFIDDRHVKTVPQSPGYPMQFMLDVYRFPADDAADGDPDDHSPVFIVDRVSGHRMR